MSCKICESLISSSEKLIFETKYWKVFLSYHQKYLGRCYIILKRHCSELSQLTQEEILDFLEMVKQTENLIKKTFNATMFNWSCLMNDAYRDNQEAHVHWHLRPRYNEEVQVQGVIFKDKEFGKHYERIDEEIAPDELRDKILSELKANLRSI